MLCSSSVKYIYTYIYNIEYVCIDVCIYLFVVEAMKKATSLPTPISLCNCHLFIFFKLNNILLIILNFVIFAVVFGFWR